MFLFPISTPALAQGPNTQDTSKQDTTNYWAAGQFTIEESKIWLSYTHVPKSDWFSVAVVEPKNGDYHNFKVPTVMSVNCKTGDFSFQSGFVLKKDGELDIESMNMSLADLARGFCEAHKKAYTSSNYWN